MTPLVSLGPVLEDPRGRCGTAVLRERNRATGHLGRWGVGLMEMRMWRDQRDGKRWLIQVPRNASSELRSGRRLVTFQHPSESDMSVKELRTRPLDRDPPAKLSDEALMRLLDEAGGAT